MGASLSGGPERVQLLSRNWNRDGASRILINAVLHFISIDMQPTPNYRKAGLFLIPFVASAFLAGCFEEDENGQTNITGEELEGLQFDLNRARKFLEDGKVKLAASEKAAVDSKLAAKLDEELKEISSQVESATARNTDLADEIELTVVEFDQYQAKYRKMVRDALVGTNVDLSSKKGDGYKDVRVLGIDPTAVKVYQPSGPESVPIKDLPAALVEKLQMDEEEADRYREKLASNATALAKQFKVWEEKQVEKKDDAAKEAIQLKMREIREEIVKREHIINRKIQQIKAWKSKASQLDARVAEERAQGRRQKSDKLAELARAKADILADQNSDSWVVIERLKVELNYLERLEKSQ